MLKPSLARSLLAGMRLLIGLGALMAPKFGARLFGLEPERNPGLPYTMRLFAVRDAAMGVGLLRADSRDQHQWLDLGIASDVSDVGAALLAGRSGALPKRAAAMCALAATVAVGLGVAARGPEFGVAARGPES